jgi:CRP/FNR family transcriptional regulator
MVLVAVKQPAQPQAVSLLASVCGALSGEELQQLNAIARQTKMAAGSVIFRAQEETRFFATIVSGAVKLSKSFSDGRQQIVGLQFAPDFLGRTYGAENPYFAEAVTNVELCQFPRDGYEKLLGEFPALEQRLFADTLQELDAARDWMLLLGRKTAREKVASFLLLLVRRAGDQGCEPVETGGTIHIELPMTRADIGDYLGLTIETVSRQMTRLKSQKIIEMVNSRIIAVPDVGLLAEIADHSGEGGL